ncbi:helix-hairpin-helix domain-containing protein [Lactobacillus acetotolerans]|uniref:Competence protein ComEA n=1 Tax=Lactobacillus acetotolerans TaxID=1600 RepID=A0A0D6A4I7_9LACO|nr:helix-hairpin-helix domain-containing protein [Lactobacillus acetotolerans]MBN7277105.1 ComEA family DNA-binding protein [Lactobacillus acetotolerans]QGV04495.1 ComEA family DNA-binding protein [Lactobacillus acetotolerans]BAQ57380.1 competence protein ComEA [Lactobacillus acetotolerans]
MDFDKIKNFVIEKKKYFLITLVVLVLLFWFKQGDSGKTDNSNVLNEKTEKVGSSTSSAKGANVASKAEETKSKTVTCDISGAVKNQGVYTLKNGARLQELIEAAGGTVKKAQLKAVNRALLLKDQDKIHIPYKGEKVDNATTVASANGSASAAGSGASGQSGEKVNLNTAAAADLQKLNGIGEKKAEQIIAYREENGQFKKIEDLTQVSGIGEKTFAALKDQLEI